MDEMSGRSEVKWMVRKKDEHARRDETNGAREDQEQKGWK